MPKTLYSCPCNCGEVLDPDVSTDNVWHKDDPFWTYRCMDQHCDAYGVDSSNQRGDPFCPFCGEMRDFVGHYNR